MSGLNVTIVYSGNHALGTVEEYGMRDNISPKASGGLVCELIV
jgi:hypothetical protein